MKRIIKRFIISCVAVVFALSSNILIGAGALSSSRSASLQNGYTHKLAFNISSSSGTSTFSITSGGPCEIKNILSAIEFNSSGAVVRTVTSELPRASTTSRTCSVSRSSSSNVLKNFSSTGYNYTSGARSRVSGNSYFRTIEIGDKGIETLTLNP